MFWGKINYCPIDQSTAAPSLPSRFQGLFVGIIVPDDFTVGLIRTQNCYERLQALGSNFQSVNKEIRLNINSNKLVVNHNFAKQLRKFAYISNLSKNLIQVPLSIKVPFPFSIMFHSGTSTARKTIDELSIKSYHIIIYQCSSDSIFRK